MVHFIPSASRKVVMLAAQADSAPVLITGASGTGREGIARWIHSNGPRAGHPFVIAKHGTPLAPQIATAASGTLLISEVGELPFVDQKVLLGFLKTRSLARESGVQALTPVRIIATTSQALEGRARGGLFNPELLDALRIFQIEMPPLAKRGNEFVDIAEGLLREIAREAHKSHLRGFSDQAWSVLRDYDWPGNVRELRNVISLSVARAEGSQIEAGDLPQFGHDRVDFRATREQFEKIYLLEVMRTVSGQLDRAAHSTRMDRPTLEEKLKKYGII